MKNIKSLKGIQWEWLGALAIILFIVFVMPELIWIFAFIQIFIILFGVFYYKFVWRCPHCKLKNPTLRILVSKQKVCDECFKRDVPAY